MNRNKINTILKMKISKNCSKRKNILKMSTCMENSSMFIIWLKVSNVNASYFLNYNITVKIVV